MQYKFEITLTEFTYKLLYDAVKQHKQVWEGHKNSPSTNTDGKLLSPGAAATEFLISQKAVVYLDGILNELDTQRQEFEI